MRELGSSFVVALRAIGRAKVRTTLTVLGILIGVAAVVIVTALGTGVKERIAGQIRGLGSNLVFVFSQPNQTSGARSRSGQLGRLTEADARAILREATSVAAIAPFLQAQAQVVAGDRNVLTSAVGSTRGYFAVRGFAIASGAAWTTEDETLRARVIVLGATVKTNLFGGQDPVGQVIRIGRHAWRVIGVTAPKGTSPSGEDQDDRVMVPSTSFRTRILPTSVGRVHMLLAQATAENTTDRAVKQIDAILRQRHGIDPEREPDFGIRTQAEFLKMQDEVLGTLRALLVGIALVSLGVGGVGVMNIMLVSVAERTREIGIRMAIGAREGAILAQFLVEAVVLCLIGGIAGTAVGLGGIWAMARSLGWSMLLPPEALAMALGTSVAVGVVFGFLPARRAARLDPIDALRHE